MITIVFDWSNNLEKHPLRSTEWNLYLEKHKRNNITSKPHFHILMLWNDARRNEATKRGERPRKSETGSSSRLFFRFYFHLSSLVVLLCHCFPVGACGLKDDSDTKIVAGLTCHLKEKKTFADYRDMFQKNSTMVCIRFLLDVIFRISETCTCTYIFLSTCYHFS